MKAIQKRQGEEYDVTREDIPKEVGEELREELGYSEGGFTTAEYEWPVLAKNPEAPFVTMVKYYDDDSKLLGY